MKLLWLIVIFFLSQAINYKLNMDSVELTSIKINGCKSEDPSESLGEITEIEIDKQGIDNHGYSVVHFSFYFFIKCHVQYCIQVLITLSFSSCSSFSCPLL